MLRVGICDDEAGARDALHLMLDKLSNREGMEFTIYEFSSGGGVIGWLQKHAGELDLLFLDIEMPEMGGMDAARQIRLHDSRLIIVFVTGYADFVFDGYAVAAMDYLMKPADEARLREVVQRALGHVQLAADKTYTVRNADGMYRLPLADILYCYSDRRLVTVVTARREYAFYGKLDALQKELGKGFVRIHQRYLVRAAAVDQLEGSEVFVGGAVLPVSRGHRQSAMLEIARTLLNRGDADAAVL